MLIRSPQLLEITIGTSGARKVNRRDKEISWLGFYQLGFISWVLSVELMAEPDHSPRLNAMKKICRTNPFV